MADRNFGVGFDQLLLVEPPGKPDVDFRYRIFNADGSEVEQCGNGARCFAAFVREKKLSNKDCIRVETKKGDIELQINENGQVLVDMGEPVFEPENIPFSADAEADIYALEVAGEVCQISAVSMGNPHAVLQVSELSDAQVARLGPLIESHERFPEKVNVGFMEIVHKRFVKLRVFERGVGEDLGLRDGCVCCCGGWH